MKMNGFMRLALAAVMTFVVACSTTPSSDDPSDPGAGEFGSDFGGGGADGGSSGGDEFAEFGSDDSSGFGSGSGGEGLEGEMAAQDPAPASGDNALDDEFAQFDEPQGDQPQGDFAGGDQDPFAPQENAGSDMPPADLPPADPFAENPGPQDPGPAPDMGPDPGPVGEPDMNYTETPPPEAPAPTPEAPEAPVSPGSGPYNITDIQYRANDNGGTVVIEATGPLEFNKRMNPETQQFVIEIPNSKLPRKLKRPFNTRDFAGTIGSIDAYQGRNSTTSRIVVQLRPGSPEPVIQAEGNNLFVVALPPGDQNETDGETAAAESLPSNLMASENIEEFLSTNQKFYGKKISIETDDAELRDVFRLISEESNVNLIISDEVRGRISLKLKNVPWDQALVMIMKSKKLGYTRAGNVLRIAPLADIKAEEEDVLKFIAARKANATLKVKTIPVNYARVEDLEKQVRPLMSAKGSVVGDMRTSSLVISDLDENMDRAEKLIRALDVPPQQVLIEGKVVEATDNFQRVVGVNWGLSGRPFQSKTLRSSSGPVRSTTSMNVTPSLPTASTFGLNFNLGTLDILGDLSATLRLFESQDLLKVISSPRVVTLHNEPAEISQTEEIPLITATVAPNGATTPSVNFKPVRLRLQVTPQITNDGAIIMGVDVAREVAGAVVDPATNARPVNSRAAKTKVIVRNSQTAVIGGIYQNEMTEGEQRLPGIASLPVVGWLFKTNAKTKRRNELLIFLTPRVLGQLESASGSPGSGFGGDL